MNASPKEDPAGQQPIAERYSWQCADVDIKLQLSPIYQSSGWYDFSEIFPLFY